MQKKARLFLTVLFLLCSVCGCKSYTIVNGRRVEMLSADEEAILLAYAKEIALRRADQLKLTPAEVEFIRTREPAVRSDYMEDRIGRYIYDWDFSTEKMLRITFGGYLLTDKMVVRAQTFHDTCGGEDGNQVKMISR